MKRKGTRIKRYRSVDYRHQTPPRAPFPYWGGKRRAADLVWQLLGRDVYSYVDPFGGSLAIPLSAPHHIPRVVVNDRFGLLVNAWRALQAEPEATAYYADYPTSHLDLIARNAELRAALPDVEMNVRRYSSWYNVKLAGFYMWAVSNSIDMGTSLGDGCGTKMSKRNGVTAEAEREAGTLMGRRGGVGKTGMPYPAAGDGGGFYHHGRGVARGDVNMRSKGGRGGVGGDGGNAMSVMMCAKGGRQGVGGDGGNAPLSVNMMGKGGRVGVSRAEVGGFGQVGGDRPARMDHGSKRRKGTQGLSDGGFSGGSPVMGGGLYGRNGLARQETPGGASPLTGGGKGGRPGVGRREPIFARQRVPVLGGQSGVGRQGKGDSGIVTGGGFVRRSIARQETPSTGGGGGGRTGVVKHAARSAGGLTRAGDYAPQPLYAAANLYTPGLRLLPWFRQLQAIIARWFILCQDWRKIVNSPSTLAIVPSEKSKRTALVLDPPYDDDRSGRVYAHDNSSTAAEVRLWLMTPNDRLDGIAPWHNPRLRIVYCGYDGDFSDDELPGAVKHHWHRGGGMEAQGKHGKKKERRETLWASPSCLTPGSAKEPEGVQQSMF